LKKTHKSLLKNKIMSQYFRVFDLQAASGNFTGVLTANAGITANTSPITANAGITVTAGTSSFNARPKVDGTNVALVTDIPDPVETGFITRAWVNFDGGDHVGVYYNNGPAIRTVGSNIVSINMDGHGLATNNIVYLSFDNNDIVEGTYTVEVIDNNNFKITTAATTAKNTWCYLATITPRAGGNIKNISKFGADSNEDLRGRYVVNFNTPMQDANYAITAAGYQTYVGTSRADSNGAVNGRPLSAHAALITVVSFGSNLENWRYIMATFVR